MSTTTAHNPGRNPGIDMLRGIAILLVLLNHIGGRIRLADGILARVLSPQVMNDITSNGWEGVFIFFVISGFLIATNSLQRWGGLGEIDAGAFYVRRASRILPCLVGLVVMLSILHVAHVPDYVILKPQQSLPKAIASALGFYLNWFEAHTGYLPGSWDVLWSLSIEEVFYVGFPLVCLLLRRDWILAPLLAILTLSQPFALRSIVGNPIWREKAYLPGMAAIAAGVLAAIAAAHIKRDRKGLRVALIAAGACGVFADLGFEDNLFHWMGFWVMLLLTLSAALLVLGFHLQARAAREWRLPGTGWLQSCGRLSYEIYLTHMFVVLTAVRIYRMSHAGNWWGVLWFAPTIILAWALGRVVAKFYSVPCEQAMRKWWMPRPRAQEPAAIVAN